MERSGRLCGHFYRHTVLRLGGAFLRLLPISHSNYRTFRRTHSRVDPVVRRRRSLAEGRYRILAVPLHRLISPLQHPMSAFQH